MAIFFQVSLARPSNDSIKGANLYVSGLPKTVTETELEALFITFGNVISLRILTNTITGKNCFCVLKKYQHLK